HFVAVFHDSATDCTTVTLMCKYRKDDPNFSVLDLKAYYRGYRYVIETIKILPQLPDENLVSQLFQKVTALGRIHPAKLPAFSG
ncbi:MAG TPA: hypothetical protein PKN65_10520, partial [Tenuifilaceae bacterium]|nr:hypothetical protein [Tenuifilaceae bacterium]